MTPNIEEQIAIRSAESGLPGSLLRAVYLRETQQSHSGGTSLTAAAFARVDEFIVYALTRDTNCSRDRDLTPSARAL